MRIQKEKYAKIFSLIGIHLLVAPSSFIWNYGNLSAYMESYFHFYCNSICIDSDSQFIPNLFVASICPGIYLSGPISSYLGLKWAGIVSMVICNVGLISSAWTLQVSVAATAVTMGFLNGLGMGMSLCVGFMYVSVWTDKNKGLFIATVTSAPTILSVFQNQVITAYVNPRNLKPDVEIVPRTYFSDTSMLERVPVVVLILGLMTLGLQLIGILFVLPPPSTLQSDLAPVEPVVNTPEACKADSKERFNYCKHDSNTPISLTKSAAHDSEITVINSKEPQHYCSSDRVKKTDPAKTWTHDRCTESIDKISESSSTDIEKENSFVEQSPRSYKPLEAVRTRPFVALWFFVVALMYGMILKNNYYKQFGLIYIQNDRLLTLLGSLIPIIASIARITFGSLMDRDILGIRSCMVLILSINSLLCSFWWFAPQVNSIAYMLLVLALASMQSVTYTLAAAGTLQIFGPDHFAGNFALIYTAVTFIAILSAFTVTPMLQSLGWFWLFASCSIVSALVLFLPTSVKMEVP